MVSQEQQENNGHSGYCSVNRLHRGFLYLKAWPEKSSGLGKTVALFADDKKITNYDLAMAHRELEVLTMLRTEDILRSMGVPLFRTPDFRAVMLGELLFSERSLSPQVIRVIKQTIRTNEYRISEKQLNDIYMGKSAGSNLYWLLLKKKPSLPG